MCYTAIPPKVKELHAKLLEHNVLKTVEVGLVDDAKLDVVLLVGINAHGLKACMSA